MTTYDLSNAVVGDVLCIEATGWGRSTEFYTVERVTATTLVCKTHKFRKKDGYLVGQVISGFRGYTYARMSSPAEMKAYEERMKLSAFIRALKPETLSVDQMRRIRAITKECEALNG